MINTHDLPHGQLPGSLELAYLGDTVYDLYVRRRLVVAGGRMKDLHRAAVSQVRASAQSEALARVEDLLSEEEKQEAEAKAEEWKGFLTFVKETLGDQVKEVRLSSNLGSHPVCMTPDTGMSFEMEKYMKRVNPEFAFPVGRILELNADHEAVMALKTAMTEDPLKAADYAALLMYQAQLMADLPIEDPVAYTALVCKLMK